MIVCVMSVFFSRLFCLNINHYKQQLPTLNIFYLAKSKHYGLTVLGLPTLHHAIFHHVTVNYGHLTTRYLIT